MMFSVCVFVCVCMCVVVTLIMTWTLFCYIAEHLKWYFEDLHPSRVTTKIDIGEGSDVRLLKKVHKIIVADNFHAYMFMFIMCFSFGYSMSFKKM